MAAFQVVIFCTGLTRDWDLYFEKKVLRLESVNWIPAVLGGIYKPISLVLDGRCHLARNLSCWHCWVWISRGFLWGHQKKKGSVGSISGGCGGAFCIHNKPIDILLGAELRVGRWVEQEAESGCPSGQRVGCEVHWNFASAKSGGDSNGRGTCSYCRPGDWATIRDGSN